MIRQGNVKGTDQIMVFLKMIRKTRIRTEYIPLVIPEPQIIIHGRPGRAVLQQGY
jgi:hypothetical protein